MSRLHAEPVPLVLDKSPGHRPGFAARVLLPHRIDACGPALGARVHRLQGKSMGSSWRVNVCASPTASLLGLEGAIQRTLDEIVSQMSPWSATSDISRFNCAAPDTWHGLPPAFTRVLCCALDIARLSGGAFDPTAGELVDLWGFGPPGPVGEPPSAVMLHEAMKRVGWQRLRRDASGKWLQPGGLRLDLSAIAKGDAVDAVSHELQRLGFTDHLVEVGGELRGSGVRPDGQPWWVELAAPPGAEPLGATRIALHGLSVATSGTYVRRYTDSTGVSRSHTMDPRSGLPVSHGTASVSVVHADCMLADAWSTALGVLDAEAALSLAARHGIAVMLVEQLSCWAASAGDWATHLSPAMHLLAT